MTMVTGGFGPCRNGIMVICAQIRLAGKQQLADGSSDQFWPRSSLEKTPGFVDSSELHVLA